MGRRLLVVHPGASWSTHDVYVGLTDALRDQGHEIITYLLDGRIERSVSWLRHCYEVEIGAGRDAPEPTQADYLMHAVSEIFYRAAIYEVHAVLFISGMYVPLPIMRGLYRFNVPTGLVLTESPYDEEQERRWAALAHMVWTNERTSVETLRAVNPRTYYLPAAYDPVRHQPYPQVDDEDTPAHDVVFIGTGFPERVDLLSAVDWTGIDLGLYGNWEIVTDEPGHPLAGHVKGGVIINSSAASLYRRARIGLNLYRTSIGFSGVRHIGHAESLNPRAYELAACGCFQMASWREEAGDIFRLPVGVVALGRVHDDLPLDEAGALLTEDIRDHLGGGMAANYAREAERMVRPHTFAARARQLMAQFEAVLTDAWGPPAGPETSAHGQGDAPAARDADPPGEGDDPRLGGMAQAAAGETLA